jgi:hypothetical protein
MAETHHRKTNVPHRIEIRFCGPAPSDELSRARIIGNPDIADAMKALQERLEAVGFPCEIEVQTIKTGAPKTRAVHGRLNEAAE